MLPLRMLGILTLMFLLCDADSSCPDDTNPLILDPPEIIGTYGDEVIVNCSNSEMYHDGLYLRLGNIIYSDDDDENFVTGTLTLSDSSVKAECRIKLSETRECTKDVKITINDAPELNPDPSTTTVVEGEDVTLTCEARGNPPPVFQWTCSGMDISASTTNLTITEVTTSTTCSCTATNPMGSKTKPFYVRVIKRRSSPPTPGAPADRGCPLILTPAEVVVKFGDPVSVNCSVASTTDFWGMGWEAEYGGTGFENKPSLTWTVDKLEEWDIEPACYMNFMNNEQCFVTPDVTVYKTPDNVTVSDSHEQMVEGGTYLLFCDIINVAPVQNLRVIWYRGDEIINTEMFNQASVTPVSVSPSLRVTVDRHHDRALFRCKAELHLGPELIPTTASLPYTADVHYAPVFKEGSYSMEVISGENVTLPCSAEGNPAPEIQWHYKPDVILMETTGRRQRNITITGATSTNSAVYNCIATNKVGKVTRSVTLAVKDKSRGIPSMLIWLLVIILLLIILVIIIVCVCRSQKKHGQHNFGPSRATDGADIPMTPNSNGVKA